jgi:hypothetical protein
MQSWTFVIALKEGDEESLHPYILDAAHVPKTVPTYSVAVAWSVTSVDIAIVRRPRRLLPSVVRSKWRTAT